MRLIDADALLKMGSAKKIIEVVGNWDELSLKAKSACVRLGVAHKRLILNAPTVDAVEVVRCKDCIHWYEPEGVCLKIYSDGAVSPCAWQDRKFDDFCSYGERR